MRRLAALLCPEYVFLVQVLVAGLYMVFVTGPFQAPDESTHFFRAYQISEGKFFGVRIGEKAGGWLPEAIPGALGVSEGVSFHVDKKIDKKIVMDMLRRPFNVGKRVFIEFPTTVLYFPLSYMPQAIGITASRLCGLSALAMMYAGRLFNLLFWAALIFIAIRLTPVFKWVIALVGLLPMSIFIAASLSADTMNNACAILFIALILRARFKETVSITLGMWVLIAVLCMAISIQKLVYAPLIGLILIVPRKRYGGKTLKIICCSAIIAVSLLAVYLWGLEIKRMYVPIRNFNIQEQIRFILADPGRYVIALVKTVLDRLFFFLASFIGILGWQDTLLPLWIYLTYPPVLVATALFDGVKNSKPLYLVEKAWLAISCFVSFLFIMTSLYIYWSKVGAAMVEGIQGRYLLLLAVPALLILYNRRVAFSEKFFFRIMAAIYSVAVLFTTCLIIYARYYG